jgi:predicted metal-dependent peptidase
MDNAITTTKFHMDELIRDIYQELPFLGYALQSIKRMAVTDNPDFRASIDSKNVLLYNPAFFAETLTTEPFRKAILFHEVLHKVFNHFVRADKLMENILGKKFAVIMENELSKMTYGEVMKFKVVFSLFNRAADCAIHEIIPARFPLPLEIPGGLVTRDGLEKQHNITLEPKREMEYYFYEIWNAKKDDMKNLQNLADEFDKFIEHQMSMPQNENSDSNSDPSSGNSEGGNNESDKEIEKSAAEYQEEFRGIMRKATEKQREHEAKHGTGVGSLFNILPDFNFKIKEPSSFWKKLIAKSFGSKVSPDRYTTMRRPDRRNEENIYGKLRKNIGSHVCFVIDSSGSISPETIAKSFGYINKTMRKQGLTIDLLFCHTNVYAEFRNLKSIPLDFFKHNQIQSGGTDMTKAQDWIEKNYKNQKETTAIFLTDGETPWKTGYKYQVNAIYGVSHRKLPGVKNFAILD